MSTVERRLLQVAIALGAAVPVLGGIAGIVLGIPAGDGSAIGPALDSHYRYLSGLLLGIGLGFWSLLPRIETRTARFRLLTLIVVVGGVARAWSLLRVGMPGAAMLGALAMELLVTPLLCLWQGRVARNFLRNFQP